MVSKVVKRTPTKSLRYRKNLPQYGRRRISPTKNPTSASVVVASINRSIHSCHRRLIKIFAKLAARSSTPTKKTPRPKKGYQILEKVPSEHPVPPRTLFDDDPTTLPPPPFPHRKTVFLDLDETLVHSTPTIPPERYDFVVNPTIDGENVQFFVLKRPFVDEFLNFLSRASFEIVIFTAGIEEYASLVVDRLDHRGLVSHRLYRDACKEVDGRFVKDLSGVGRQLQRSVIVDDNPISYQLQPENAVPVLPFTNDLQDVELKRLIWFFGGHFDSSEDVRDAVRDYLGDSNVGDV